MFILPKTSSPTEGVACLPYKTIGLASIAVGVAALGLYLGREIRCRYKFKRRTPYERFSHAGEETAAAEFGMGI